MKEPLMKSPRMPRTMPPPVLPVDRVIDLAPLLDPGEVTDQIANRLGTDGQEILECRIRHVRYRPRESCVVLYDVDYRYSGQVNTTTLYAKNLAGSELVRPGALAGGQSAPQGRLIPSPLVLPSIDAVFREFPDDPKLPAIRNLADRDAFARDLSGKLGQAGEPGKEFSGMGRHARIIRYKPENRLIVRCRIRWRDRASAETSSTRCLLRFERRASSRHAFALPQVSSGRDADSPPLSTPRVLFHLPAMNCTGFAWITGTKLSRLLKDNDSRQNGLSAAARALAILHDTPTAGLPVRGWREHLRTVTDWQTRLQGYPTGIRHKVDEVVRRLTELARVTSAGPSGFVHGDFHQGQLLLARDHPYVIDLDGAYHGETAADLGRFVGQLELLALRGRLGADSSIGDQFMTEYEGVTGRNLDQGRIDFWCGLTLFGLAFKELRRLKPDWNERATAILTHCLARLSRSEP